MNFPTRKLFTAQDMVEAYERGFKASTNKRNGEHINNPDDGGKLRKDAEFAVWLFLKRLTLRK